MSMLQDLIRSRLRGGAGSLCCCTGNGKIYSLGSDGTWTEVAG